MKSYNKPNKNYLVIKIVGKKFGIAAFFALHLSFIAVSS